MRLDAIRVKIKMRVTGRGLDFDHRVVKRKGKKKLEDVKCGGGGGEGEGEKV